MSGKRNRASRQPILFMLVGLPASGKSKLAEMLSTENDFKPVIHSSDALRFELYGSESNQEHNNELFNELHKRIKADLKNGSDVVYDATNIVKKRRIAFMKELTHIKCYKVCVCILTPYELCLKQNACRERAVPESAIRKMYLSWCPPSIDEGFDEVVLEYRYGNINKKRKYSLNNFFYGEIGACAIGQENKHHTKSIGEHCLETARYIKKHYPNNSALRIAAVLHDIGKPFTKSHVNSRGEICEECHYYNHQHCGAYDSFFYTDVLNIPHEERIHISNLIYYHMYPFLSWKQSEKAENRAKAQIGEDFYREVMQLHEADLAAH